MLTETNGTCHLQINAKQILKCKVVSTLVIIFFLSFSFFLILVHCEPPSGSELNLND